MKSGEIIPSRRLCVNPGATTRTGTVEPQRGACEVPQRGSIVPKLT